MGSMGSCTSGAAAAVSDKHAEAPLLLFDDEIPELFGFARFLGAALGCFDDAHGQLHDLLLSCALWLLLEQRLEAPAGGCGFLGMEPRILFSTQ
jgi:hypothetical protein